MDDALADAFRAELPCSRSTAAVLAALAREKGDLLGGGSEDTDEDRILRLRDPRTFGAFAEWVLRDRRADTVARDAVAEHAFDLLSLARSEGDVIAVETRAPPRLLALAAYLAESQGLTVLHVMHLVYAVFLDHSLVVNVPRPVRARVYQAILHEGDTGEDLRTLYACLHLAAVAEPEAAAEFRRTLRSRACPRTLRHRLATMAAAADGGRAALAGIARHEGLLPAELREPQAPGIQANIPRFPERLAAAGRRFLEQDASDGPEPSISASGARR